MAMTCSPAQTPFARGMLQPGIAGSPLRYYEVWTMSLRAKIEAVVYAAEEPVTLAQLAAVFAEEVRELQQLAAANTADDMAPDDMAPPDLPLEEAASPAAPAAESAEAASLPEAMTAAAASGPAVPEAGNEAPPAADPDEAAAKRAARQQERAVREYLRGLLDELMAELDASDRGVEIREIAGGYRMATRPEYHDAIRSFVKSLKPPMKLSLQALETLAVVAYKQPVTAPEISEIRGVESAGVLGSLMARKLITTAGRKQVIGRPILYKTTKEFLLRFGLKDLNELPSIEEFEKMAGELADADLEPMGAASEQPAPEPADTLPDSTVLQQEAPLEPEPPLKQEAPLDQHSAIATEAELANEAGNGEAGNGEASDSHPVEQKAGEA
jgi:segregation and condensation protein B